MAAMAENTAPEKQTSKRPEWYCIYTDLYFLTCNDGKKRGETNMLQKDTFA